MRLHLITDSDIEAASRVADMDSALAPLAALAACESGDVAALAFGGIENWADMTPAEREQAIRHWIDLERLYSE